MEVENGTGAETGGSEEINVDALLADVAAGRDTNPAEPAPAAAPAEQIWNGEEWAFETGGKKIVPDSREKIKIWASQGYNYSQRAGELNKTHADRMAAAEKIAQDAAEERERFAPYADVDKYAQENKDWWDHVQESFKNRETHGVDPTIAKVLAPLQAELGALKKIISADQQAKEQAAFDAAIEQEDQALSEALDSIRKEHPNIDLAARDESGETLENRVSAYAKDLGLTGARGYRAAFRDYLHDKLVVQSSTQTKLQAVRGTQAQAKAGILGTTQAPTKELKPVNTRLPWNDESLSAQAVLHEFRQTHGG